MKTKTDLWVHAIWATHDRRPAITPEVGQLVKRILFAKCRELHCSIEALGGTADHVHLVAGLHPALAPARLVGELKGASAHAVNHRLPTRDSFQWQRGYAAFTVSRRELPALVSYVREQALRHGSKTTERDLELPPDELTGPFEPTRPIAQA